MADQSGWHDSQVRIIERELKDEAFRRELVSNPKAAIQSELGIQIPHGTAVHLHKATSSALYVVLPPPPGAR